MWYVRERERERVNGMYEKRKLSAKQEGERSGRHEARDGD